VVIHTGRVRIAHQSHHLTCARLHCTSGFCLRLHIKVTKGIKLLIFDGCWHSLACLYRIS